MKIIWIAALFSVWASAAALAQSPTQVGSQADLIVDVVMVPPSTEGVGAGEIRSAPPYRARLSGQDEVKDCREIVATGTPSAYAAEVRAKVGAAVKAIYRRVAVESMTLRCTGVMVETFDDISEVIAFDQLAAPPASN